MPRTPSGKAITASPCSRMSMQFFGVPTTPPTAGHEDVEERQGGEPVLTHALQRARRIGLEHGCRPDHGGIDRDLPSVIADHEHAPRRQVLYAVRLHPEVVAVEERHHEERAPRDVDVEPP